MDINMKRELEYEEQLFQYSSRFLIDSFKNCIKDELETTITSLTNNVRNKLVKDCKNPDVFNEKVNEMKDALTAEYLNSFESVSEANKNNIAEFMHIPNNVLLKEDLPVKIGMKVDPVKIDEEIKQLENRCKAQKFLKEKILEEMEMADSAIFLLEKFIDDKDIKFDVLPTESLKLLTEIASENLQLIS